MFLLIIKKPGGGWEGINIENIENDMYTYILPKFEIILFYHVYKINNNHGYFYSTDPYKLTEHEERGWG